MALGPKKGFTEAEQAQYKNGEIDRFGNPIAKTADGKTTRTDPASVALQQFLDYAKQTQAQNTGMLEGQVKPSIDALGSAAERANARDTLLGGARFGNTGELSGEIDKYGLGLDENLGKFKTRYDEIAKDLNNINWEDAQSAGEGLEAQRAALAKYKSLSDPTVTAQERFMAENARRQTETQERASRDAVMSDLGARGMRGSGAELTNMLGSQQLTGQNRVLNDMAMNANAVDRSMTALKGYGDVAGSMRQSDDVIEMFNKGQGQLAKQWKQEEAGREESARFKGVNDGLAQKNKADSDKFSIWDKYYDDMSGDADREYGRARDQMGANLDYGRAWTGANSSGAGGVMSGYGQIAGNITSLNAAKMLNQPKSGLLGLGWGPL